jgi:hypothetical protein
MKLSLDHKYEPADLNLGNIIVILLKYSEFYLTSKDVLSLSNINSLYKERINDIFKLRTMDVSKLQEPKIGYAEQNAIQSSCVDMATVCLMHYFLHSGMIIRYLKCKYIGENRNVTQIL